MSAAHVRRGGAARAKTKKPSKVAMPKKIAKRLPVDQARANEAGCDGVLAKPFEPQLVISRVKELLGRRGPSSAPPAAPVAQNPWLPAAPGAASSLAAAPPQPLDDYFDRLDAALAVRRRLGERGGVEPSTLLLTQARRGRG